MPLDDVSRSPAPVVLVVDDDAAVRDVVRRFLEADGYVVHQAESGRRALELLRQGIAVSAVITDLIMPEGSGGWLLAQLAYEFPRLLPCIVLVSGNAGSTGAAHVAVRWRTPVLPKPFTSAQLITAVRHVAERQVDTA
ncbi:MAG: histidine kinase [Gemmatimonadetes bacterium]|jgi:CheY-like chemotaxis protein|nr:histidine kinase [Gemmatimonadota bacterium]